jgi:hypothetical protein
LLDQEFDTLAFPSTIEMEKDKEPPIITNVEASVQTTEVVQPSTTEDEQQPYTIEPDKQQMREEPKEVTFDEDTQVEEASL